MGSEETVRAYKHLAKVEGAFRCMKAIDLEVRPIHHWVSHRTGAHGFLCRLAYYVEWHVRWKLAPVLFEDDQKELAEALRESVAAPAEAAPSAEAKTKRTADGMAVRSFRTLVEEVGTPSKNRLLTPALQTPQR